MEQPPRIRVEDCWADGGRLSLEVHEGGDRVRLRGNNEGFIGLARILLWVAHNGLEDGKVVDLSVFDAFAPGTPCLDLGSDL